MKSGAGLFKFMRPRKNHRHDMRILVIVTAFLNISLYYHIFVNELPKGENGSGKYSVVDSTNPLSIRVLQSITQSKISIDVWRGFCPRPTVRLRLVGPEIHVFPVFTLDSYQSPLDVDIQSSSLLLGVYKVEATLRRCNEGGNAMRTMNECRFESEIKWNNSLNIGSYDGNDWAWVHSPKCSSNLNEGQRSLECEQPDGHFNEGEYVFMEIDRDTKSPKQNNLVTLKDGVTALAKPTTLLATSDDSSLFKFFNQLSNYELVCWLGDSDAEEYFRSFMGLFPRMGSGQRPFKFKFLTLKDISDPTKDFSDTSHQTFNKCKIFFISYGIDRFDAGISPKLYHQEVEMLLNHIEQSQPEKTAWFLSSRSSPSIDENTSGHATSCVEGSVMQTRSPDRIHAFNEESRRIFHARKTESHIHYMDNSHITEAFSHIVQTNEENTKNQHMTESHITAAVAMQCMEMIALQVKAWRSQNQIGTVHGLMKNGTLIPNDELFKEPYAWGK